MSVLFIDDDDTGRQLAVYNLRKAGVVVHDAADGAAGLAAFDAERHRVVVTDLKMPVVDGMSVLAAVHRRAPEVPVIVITAFGGVDKAVQAMQAGAYDFIEKPFSRDRLELTVRRALEASALRQENRTLRSVERPMVAESEAMQEVLALADRVAASTAPVLITGESGVGKELIARRLHSRSGRSAGPFVAVNCAAIPSELLESELFGHTRGAYTGASRAREGRFRRANGGTLFLDEVAEIPPAIQVKLLRVLQEGEVDVVGSDQPVQVDVRVVAATNQDIAARVSDGAFRDDLYYRLNVIEVQVPPLRTRPEDIAPLARSFLSELAVGPELELPDDVLAELTRRPWRGNVRELRNACERLAILTPGGQVRVDDLPRPGLGSADDRWLELIPAGMGLIDVEREVIAHTLHRTRWNVSEAARLLGVPRHILTYRIDKHGLARGD